MGTKNRGGGSLPVGVWLACLALVPMAGSAWFTLGELRDVEAARQQAETVRAAAEELVDVVELQSAILDEGLYSAMVDGAESLGVSRDVLSDLLGSDVEEQLATARRQVDAMIEDLGFTMAAHRVDAARRGSDVDAVMTSRRYRAAEAAVSGRTDEILDELLMTAGDGDGGAPLVASLQTLQDATVAREAVVSQFLNLFGVRYSSPERAMQQLQSVIEARSRYEQATRRLRRDPDTTAGVLAALSSVQSSTGHLRLRASVDGVIGSALRGAIAPDPSMETILVDVETPVREYHAGSESMDGHVDVVLAAGEAVSATAADMERAADARTERAASTIGLVVAVTVGFVLTVTAVIGRPLRRLAESVRRLSTGEASGKLRPTGPTEIRRATQALNAAVENLEWAERQARALAGGRLDDPALDECAPGAFGASLQEAVGTLARSLAEREEFRRRLSHEANHDSLTQVANRRAVMSHLERSLARTHRGTAKLAVMFIDLDGFKPVNDVEGHATGDAVLATVARRLVTSVRHGDQVGRVGGDEFVIVAEPVTGAEEAVELATRIREAVAAPVAVGDMSVSVDASIGIAVVDAHSDLSADELLRDADLAVYQAKTLGGRQVIVCDAELRLKLEERADMEHALRGALARDELTVHYQPIMGPGGEEIVALEALVRWDRPGFGLVPPDSFIPHAERSELIVEVDRWVLDAVARQMGAWADHPLLGRIPVAVNVSARHLGRTDFVDGILSRLAAHDVPFDRLILEVTESAVVDDLDHAGWFLQELRTLGVSIAIDDFGTGYSSLAHLRALPIDILKIDRSFTGDPNATSLVKLIIDTGHLLGARITSEGIETDEQATALTAMGSDELQGYLFGRPVPGDELELAITAERS